MIFFRIFLYFLIFFNIDFLFAKESDDLSEQENFPLLSKFELSYFHTSGNSYTETLSIKTNFEKKFSPIKVFKASSDGVYSKSGYTVENDDGTEYYEEGIVTHKLYVESEYDYFLSELFFSFLKGDFFDDQFSGYEYRVNFGPGIGINLKFNKDEHIIDLRTALQYSEDKAEETQIKNGYTSFKLSVNYKWTLDEKTKLSQDLEYQGSFELKENYFAKSKTGVEFKLTDKIWLGSSLQINYQNILPEEGITNTDKTFLTSLIFENIL
jgi:putative salt-induced outer membrane protein